jgi:hypothetical protein
MRPTATVTGINQARLAQLWPVGLRQYWATVAAPTATSNHVSQPSQRRNDRFERTCGLLGKALSGTLYTTTHGMSTPLCHFFIA